MKVAFYLVTFYGALGYLLSLWGRAALQQYKKTHPHH